jgi:hypothetical protein
MDSLKLLGGCAVLSVLAGVVGSLAGLATDLGANVAALAVAGVVVALVVAVSGLGVAGRANGGTPYW